MPAINLIFPHQLFEKSVLTDSGDPSILIEEYLFFKQYPFHKQKLAFHRASMKTYQAFLNERNVPTTYIDAQDSRSDIWEFLKTTNADTIRVIDPVDDYLMKRIKYGCRQRDITLKVLDSPGFINTETQLTEGFFKLGKKKFHQTDFYTQQRKSLHILLDQEQKPEGGKWTFDTENRKKYPTKKQAPAVRFPDSDHYYEEAKDYVEKHFANNYGQLGQTPRYPTSFAASRAWLRQFLEERFAAFGTYEDAIVASEGILHHSVLSPLINVGILTPDYVVDEILAYAKSHDIEINNTEGIVRQIIGWREFIRGVYIAKGVEERTKNFWGFERKLPESFYTGTTGILPVDQVIKKVLRTGYCHHIERLMVLGNFMVLCEINPDDVYQWFMELFIDSYDWVMVPNVYGMSQFADGGLMSTKPYISGSNYLMKMSDFPKGDWQKTWDGLFWRFLHTHRDFFSSNPRLKMLLSTFDKMDKEKQHQHLENAEGFFQDWL